MLPPWWVFTIQLVWSNSFVWSAALVKMSSLSSDSLSESLSPKLRKPQRRHSILSPLRRRKAIKYGMARLVENDIHQHEYPAPMSQSTPRLVGDDFFRLTRSYSSSSSSGGGLSSSSQSSRSSLSPRSLQPFKMILTFTVLTPKLHVTQIRGEGGRRKKKFDIEKCVFEYFSKK